MVEHPELACTVDPAFMDRANEVAAQAQEQQKEELRQHVAAHAADSAQQPVAQSALPFPPGYVGALAQYVYEQAPRPVPEVAVVAALGLMAGMAAREWHISNTGLNLYIVLVARSAIGKEAMHTGIAKLVNAASRQRPEVGWTVDFSDYVSGPALTKGCAQNPCFVNVAGEIGHKFLAMATDKDPGMRSLRKVLTTLYSKSGPDGIAGGISYSTQENNIEAVQAVAFSLIGETTPGTFYESITDAMMVDGFMSRFCVIEYTGDRPDKNPLQGCAPAQPVVDHIVRIVEQSMRLRAGNHFCEVAVSGEAQALLDRYERECDAAINATDDDNLRQLWNRAHLKALRIAALLAVGDNPFVPSVSLEQAEWAVKLVRHGIAPFDRRRALQKRVARIERAAMPKPSPFELLYGSFDQFVEQRILPGIEDGALDRDDMVDVVAALRRWEQDGTWAQATECRSLFTNGNK